MEQTITLKNQALVRENINYRNVSQFMKKCDLLVFYLKVIFEIKVIKHFNQRKVSKVSNSSHGQASKDESK